MRALQRGRARRAVVSLGAGALLAVVGLLGVGLGLGLGSAPAGAVGDTGLSRFIVGNPIAGWQDEPLSNDNAIVSYLDGLEGDSIVPKGGAAVNAVQGWRDPSNHADYVVVALVALRGSGSSGLDPNVALQGAVSALASLCAGVASETTVHASTVTGVTGSHTLTCTARGGLQPYAAGFARANVMALVISTTTSVTPAQLSSLVTSQYGALPAGGYVVASGSGGLGTVSEVLLGLVLLVLVGGALWLVVQRANRTAIVAPVPEPVVRRGRVQRPASEAGGVGPPPNHGVVGPRAAPRPGPRAAPRPTPRPRP
ncbi:MAG TPA: hypothetical protein VGF87_10830 [Acidimicrobiales bacterium]